MNELRQTSWKVDSDYHKEIPQVTDNLNNGTKSNFLIIMKINCLLFKRYYFIWVAYFLKIFYAVLCDRCLLVCKIKRITFSAVPEGLSILSTASNYSRDLLPLRYRDKFKVLAISRRYLPLSGLWSNDQNTQFPECLLQLVQGACMSDSGQASAVDFWSSVLKK